MSTIRLVVAEDQTMLRSAIVELLSLEADLEVVAAVGRGDEVLPAVERTRPDVVLLDIELPGMHGITVAEQLAVAAPGVAVLVITTFDRPGYIHAMITAGVAGVLLKDKAVGELPQAVRRVAAGERLLEPELALKAINDGAGPLTAREREVLEAARSHETVAQLATQLHLSAGTVRNHLSSAIQKVNARSRAEAVQIAESKGWLR
jgi:two-component system, NarL family, response regulator DesR